jgi:hypothetical protein
MSTDTEHAAAVIEDVSVLRRLSNEELYDFDPAELESIHLHWLRRRLREMRSRLTALDRLAGDIGVDDIENLDEAVALCFPHTMYKSYSLGDVEKGRFDRLTRWLGTLTMYDLSAVDTAAVESLEDWLERIEEVTPLRPITSSGTSGKISIVPKSAADMRCAFENWLRLLGPYRDEPGLDLASGRYPFLSVWQGRSGRHGVTKVLEMIWRDVYGGREEMVLSAGTQHLGADELYLMGKLRRAEATGEPLRLSEREEVLRRRIGERSRGANTSDFVEQAAVRLHGLAVLGVGSWDGLYNFALECRERGTLPEYHPSSTLLVGGGHKNYVFPDGWQDVLTEVLPINYAEAYGLQENSGQGRRCAADRFHIPSWMVQWVVDPDTGEPYPRRGVQTGRYACFDLLAEGYWSGLLTGDEVTMHWDGGCPCGRRGPFLSDDISRYGDTRGGDDKIACAKTPQAYGNLMDFVLGA